ncbi:MAG: DUF58 domain-containing protein [Spirochaetales bacterium]|nr:DUF58 domain-containing protein [Spirochaetales bacterium]
MKNSAWPARKTIVLFALPLALIILAFFWPTLGMWWPWANLLALVVLLFDGVFSPRYRKKVVLSFSIPETCRLHAPTVFQLEVTNNNLLPVKFSFLFDFDISFKRDYSKTKLRVGPKDQKTFTMELFPKRRGTFTTENIYIKGSSLFGFVSFYHTVPCAVSFRVPPFIRPMNQIFKITQKVLLQHEGFQKSAYFGEGREFEMLRDYITGDSFNRIDWSATARRRKPITRVYKIENTMEVALCIDCGRIMSTEIQGMSLLDYAVDAALILAYSAIKNYDPVSLTCFGQKIKHYIPPIKNKNDIQKLSLLLSEVEFEHSEPNYQYALGFLSKQLTKRSLVVFLTDIIDDSNLALYHKLFSVMSKRHKIMLVCIRDKNLFITSEAVVDQNTSIYTKAAAADLILRRSKTIHSLRHAGIDVLDVYPEDVSAKLLNQYLKIKSRN